MEGDFIRIDRKLLPLSWLYGLGVGFRNLLFEMKVLKSRSFDTPVISVGNITVGGTGKTPHVEYLVRLLKNQQHVAVLSRGYKRQSKGYVLANENTPMKEIGDEPYQMKHKFPQIYMAVDKDRCHGITELMKDIRQECRITAPLSACELCITVVIEKGFFKTEIGRDVLPIIEKCAVRMPERGMIAL